MMGIQQITPQSEIEAYLKQQLERMEEAIIYNLNYVGFSCINEARNNGAYNDVTGNLRASIGYVVVKDGVAVKGSGGNHSADMQLRTLASQFPQGIALIVVAGMNYASYVEAMNLNVLTSAELLAEQMVPRLLKQLGFGS